MNILILDTGNLSTHSLAELFERKNCSVTICKNVSDVRSFESVFRKAQAKLLVIAAGHEGNSSPVIKDIIIAYYKQIPILGIGSGMHFIVEAFSGRADRATMVLHGKTSKVSHDGKTLFKGVSNPFTAGRYNALMAAEVPYNFEVSARDEHNMVMGIRHKETWVEGIQFHPESILTPSGSQLIDNLLQSIKK